MPDARALVLGLHRAIVAAEGAFAHAERVLAERCAEFAGIHSLQVAEGADAGGVEVRQARLLGGRDWVRLGAVEMGLDSLRRRLKGLPVDEQLDFEKR